jgi:hypothetical protein
MIVDKKKLESLFRTWRLELGCIGVCDSVEGQHVGQRHPLAGLKGFELSWVISLLKTIFYILH